MKRDVQRTAEAKFKDKRSYWSREGHLYVRGKDVGPVRDRIFERDRGICQLRISWACWGAMDKGMCHLEHLVGGLGLKRCWCDHNLRISCPPCHRIKDGRAPRWTPRGNAR